MALNNLRQQARQNTLTRAADANRDPAETVPSTTTVPAAAGTESLAALENVAPNPLNTRTITPDSAKVLEIRDSIAEVGQLGKCAVADRAAFLAIFPEYKTNPKLAVQIGDADYVQVNGGQRWMALQLLGDRPMEIDVKNHLASSRAMWLKATMAENIARGNYDPIEEARAVRALVDELGQKQLAAQELKKSPTWVTHRLVLLELQPEIQDALRGEDEDKRFPIRIAREMGGPQWTRERQLAELEAWKAARPDVFPRKNAADDQPTGGEPPTPAPVPRQRISRKKAAILKLGSSVPEIAISLVDELDLDDARALVPALERRIAELESKAES